MNMVKTLVAVERERESHTLQFGNKIIENSDAENKAVVFEYDAKNVIVSEVYIIFRKIII